MLWTTLLSMTIRVQGSSSTCAELTVVADPTLGRALAGRYTYIEQHQQRPKYIYMADPELCIFWHGRWKLDGCDHPDPAGVIGFIQADTQHLFPQVDRGSMSLYYEILGCRGQVGLLPHLAVARPQDQCQLQCQTGNVQTES